MTHLTIFAGSQALRQIREEGINAEQFRAMLGASGGPKWFVLYGLDRYLFGEFFANRQQPLYTLGSSAGAWRMCCLATAEPVAAIDRLANRYSQESYSAEPTVAEITDKARSMLQFVLGDTGAEEIVKNPVFKTHIIADRCKGLGNSQHKALQMTALACAALSNVISRKALSGFFQRVLFSTSARESPWAGIDDIDTQLVSMNQANLFDAMIASGSIPFVLAGERNIAGAPEGLYIDGGITDYHFDLPASNESGLILYPHFSPRVVPGWFDKYLPWRKPHQSNFERVVLLTPSAEFVANLPHRKIPDRNDFKVFDYNSRQQYWQLVLDRSRFIADDFRELVTTGKGLESIKPLEFR